MVKLIFKGQDNEKSVVLKVPKTQNPSVFTLVSVPYEEDDKETQFNIVATNLD